MNNRIVSVIFGIGILSGCASNGSKVENADIVDHNPEVALVEVLESHPDIAIGFKSEELVTILFPGVVTFEVNSIEITSEKRELLESLVGILNQHEFQALVAVGHTDNTGSSEYNHQLSRERAEVVADYLTDQGVPAHRVSAEGRGPDEPIADNSSASGRAANRRVEIHVIM